MLAQVEQYLVDHASEFEADLCKLLRIPSVSADPAFKAAVRAAANEVERQLKQAGLDTRITETPGHPIVLGMRLTNPNAPTVLIYGHYDVQPPDPLHEWITPAFEPTVRDGKLYARGATDDKGQVLTHVKSLQAWVNAVGQLPVNVKVIIEGEEEVGSRNLEDFLESHKEELECDIVVVSDTSQYGPNLPAITYGLRGIFACEVVLRGPAQDLHSGVYGGAVTNPATALARMIANLHDGQGRIQIPGFYDAVTPISDQERQAFAQLPFEDAAFFRSIGTTAGVGEVGFSTLERRWARPTCEVNGLTSGYQGEGPKTIIPAWARAKITCRLVPNQDPVQLCSNLESFLRAQCPPGIKLEFTSDHGAAGVVVDLNSPFVAAARRAIARAFGVEPVCIREGGSIPVVKTFRDVLGVDTLLLGWGQNTDNLHSPNEHFSLLDFHRGIRASAVLWQELSQIS